MIIDIIRKYIKHSWPAAVILAIAALMPWGEATAQKRDERHTSRYYASRAEDYESANAWEAAKREIDQGLEYYPDDPDLRYLNGRYYYYAQRDLPKARYNLIKAIQESDHHWGARRVLIDVEDDSKHYSSAICYINELLEQQPYDRDLWRRKIALFNKMGNRVEADAALERLSRIYPNDTIIRNDLAMRTRQNWNKRLSSSTLAERANNLETWINNDPNNLDYYIELSDIYIKMGDFDKSLNTAKRGLGVFPGNSKLVQRSANLMSEQGLYTRALMFLRENRVSGTVYENMMREAANDARLRDPYDITGRLYATTGDRDALTYMLNTSLTRGYYDDALVYLQEAYKLEGRTNELMLKEYELHKRMGNENQARRLLQELYFKNPLDGGLREEYIAMQMELANIDADNEDWEGAYDRLRIVSGILDVDSDEWAAVISRRIAILGKLGELEEARRLYGEASVDNPAMRKRFASAYEDIISKRIKGLIEEERYGTALEEAQGLLSVIYDSEVALRACINMSQTLKLNDLFHQYAQLGYDYYPEEPYFIVKQALALQQQDRFAEALALLNPQKPGDLYPSPMLINPYSGVTQDWAILLMHNKMPDIAIERLDDALVYDPDNTELLYLKGLAYEQMKDFGKAYNYQSKYYNPSNAELGDWNEHMRYLRFRGYSNRIDASYTSAYYDTRTDELASVGHMYSLAHLAYSHIWKKTALTLQLGYKGSDGYRQLGINEEGGVGIETTIQLDQTLGRHWAMMLNATYGTKLFNKYGGNLGFTYSASRGWSFGLAGGYRYTLPMYLYDQDDSGWREEYKRYHMFDIKPSIEKAWERIILNGTVDLISLDLINFYYNVGLKGKFFINQDNISSVSVITGFGSFPELTFFDQTTMNGITHINAMVGMEFLYLLTKNLFVGVSGAWNTYYNPSFTQDGYAVASYRNVYTINASIHVAF